MSRRCAGARCLIAVATDVHWTCVHSIAGPPPPTHIIVAGGESNRIVITAPESYLVALNGHDLRLAAEVELDDDGRVRMIPLFWGYAITLEELLAHLRPWPFAVG